MSEYRITSTYPYPVETVWRAVTDPAIVPRWTAVGRGGTPEGFAPVVGTRFRLVGKPTIGWDGVVRCEVLEVAEPVKLVYTWSGGENETPSLVTYRLEPAGTGTTFTWEHTGFTGAGGFFMSRLLRSVRHRMLTEALPRVLEEEARSQA